MTETLFDLPDDRKPWQRSGLELAVAGEEKTYEAATDWKRTWEDVIRAFAAIPGQHFTSETVRLVAGDPDDHANACGAIFSKLAHQGVIRRVGYVKSQRPSLHNHPIAEWVGA